MTKTELKKETFTKIERSFYKHRFLLDLPKREVDPGQLYYVGISVDGLPRLAPKGEGISLFGVELLEILRY